MKKTLSVILSVVILLCSFSSVFAAESFGELVSLKITENASGLDSIISKAEFSSQVAKLMGAGEIAPKETRYADVTAENLYSGYIEFLAINGVVDNTAGIAFNPDSNVNVDMASKMLVVALGYDKLAQYMGGYPTGYSSLATSIGLFEKVTIKDAKAITKGEALSLVENALITETASSQNIINEKWDPSYKSGKTLLSDKFGLSVYYGEIEKANIGEKTVTFVVDSNKYDENPVKALSGEKLFLSTLGTVDIAGYEHVPVEIWVDENDKAVFIKNQKNVEVRYGVIDSVNDIRESGKSVSASGVNEITFLDDEEVYDVAEDFKIYYNGALQTSPVSLINKLCKVVMINDEIAQVETWQYKEKGIIKSIKDNEISYKAVNGTTYEYKGLLEYKNVRVIINSSSAAISEIKTGSVFAVWENKDDLVIVINERTVVDEFAGYSKGALTIGNGLYYTNDVYFSADGVKYTLNGDYSSLLGGNVKAYFSTEGKVKYVESFDGIVSTDEVYAYVTGVERDTMEEDEALVEFWNLSAETPAKEYLKVTKKSVFSDGITLKALESYDDTAISSADDITANIYLIKKNAKGDLAEIKKAERMLGFGGIYSTPTIFTDSVAYITAESRSLYFDKVPVTAFYKLDDEMQVTKVSFESQLRSKRIGTNAKMAFFADSEASAPELVLLWGNDVKLVGAKVIKYGIFTEKMETTDENGNKMFEVEIVTQSGKNKYVVSEETANKLTKRSFVSYYDGLLFSKDDIHISSTPLSVDGDPQNWDAVTSQWGFKRGTVVRVDDKMLVVDKRDELGNATGVEVLMAHPSQNFFMEYDSTSQNNPFKTIKSSEILSGDTVYYNSVSDGLRGVIVIR